jgi:Domain of unknown function (DUF4249)
MLKAGAKVFITLTAVIMLYRCIDPYTPKLTGYKSLLVVDGLITDENASYTVKLSRTIREQNDIPALVSDAAVFITDDESNTTYLTSTGNGIYKTDSIEFKGMAGRSYVLHIVTGQGEEYESEPCLMQPVPEIDSIYFAKDQEVVNNGTETQDGIRIYLDSKEGADNKYYRWDFEEIWKFKIPNPVKYKYISDKQIILLGNSVEFCWKKMKSSDILIHETVSSGASRIEKEPIFFIASDQSDRLLLEYHINVRQYSLSKSEYDFWDNLIKVNLTGEDIFATQPYPVISNIHNINNPKEKVLGYFQVSAVKQKIKDIPFSDIVGLNLPFYHYPCERFERSPSDYPSGLAPPKTFDDIYKMWCVNSNYYFVEPIYVFGTADSLSKLVFSRPECADCTITGTLNKPQF